jgi:PH (Pleckstrin Homology) domain-containing protein
MAASTVPQSLPRMLKATYLADQENLLEETRASKLLYFPGPVFWGFVFGVLMYVSWAPVLGWPGLSAYTNGIGTIASDLHLSAGSARFYLAALFTLVFIGILLWLTVRYLRWISTVYAVTSHRVIVQKGILSRGFDEIPVTQVRGVDVHQSFGQRLLGYGTIRVSSEGGSAIGNEDWEGIPQPFRFQKWIENATEAVQSGRVGGPSPATGHP